MARRWPEPRPMHVDELRPADHAILNILRIGRATVGYMVDMSGYSDSTIHRRLEVLVEAGHVAQVHNPTGLYELVDDPRR